MAPKAIIPCKEAGEQLPVAKPLDDTLMDKPICRRSNRLSEKASRIVTNPVTHQQILASRDALMQKQVSQASVTPTLALNAVNIENGIQVSLVHPYIPALPPIPGGLVESSACVLSCSATSDATGSVTDEPSYRPYVYTTASDLPIRQSMSTGAEAGEPSQRPLIVSASRQAVAPHSADLGLQTISTNQLSANSGTVTGEPSQRPLISQSSGQAVAPHSADLGLTNISSKINQLPNSQNELIRQAVATHGADRGPTALLEATCDEPYQRPSLLTCIISPSSPASALDTGQTTELLTGLQEPFTGRRVSSMTTDELLIMLQEEPRHTAKENRIWFTSLFASDTLSSAAIDRITRPASISLAHADLLSATANTRPASISLAPADLLPAAAITRPASISLALADLLPAASITRPAQADMLSAAAATSLAPVHMLTAAANPIRTMNTQAKLPHASVSDTVPAKAVLVVLASDSMTPVPARAVPVAQAPRQATALGTATTSDTQAQATDLSLIAAGPSTDHNQVARLTTLLHKAAQSRGTTTRIS